MLNDFYVYAYCLYYLNICLFRFFFFCGKYLKTTPGSPQDLLLVLRQGSFQEK